MSLALGQIAPERIYGKKLTGSVQVHFLAGLQRSPASRNLRRSLCHYQAGMGIETPAGMFFAQIASLVLAADGHELAEAANHRGK
jgi:hypothetical protein